MAMLYKPIKSLGQNFLIEKSTAEGMVMALDIKENDLIVEIGSGLGALTVSLVNHLPGSAKVLAVEIDERFIGKLDTMFVDASNVKVVHADILEWLPRFDAPEGFKVIGSLPYNITSPIIHAIVKKNPQPSICVILVQKEVAEKLSTPAGKASFLSSFVQTFFDVEYIGGVGKELFDPSPKVDGGIVKLVGKEPFLSPSYIEKYEGFLHKAFSHPRKMLNKPFTKEELTTAGIDGTLRPQNITPEVWVDVFKKLAIPQ